MLILLTKNLWSAYFLISSHEFKINSNLQDITRLKNSIKNIFKVTNVCNQLQKCVSIMIDNDLSSRVVFSSIHTFDNFKSTASTN